MAVIGDGRLRYFESGNPMTVGLSRGASFSLNAYGITMDRDQQVWQAGWTNGHAYRYSPNRAWQGKRLSEIAESEKKSVLEIAVEIETNGGAQIVNHGMSEEDVRVYMKQTWVATASDGSAKVADGTAPHPRSYGTFARKIGFYSIEEKAISLEAAIRSSSGLPADILGFKDRGYVRAGQFADLVIFDPKTYRDKATYEKYSRERERAFLKFL